MTAAAIMECKQCKARFVKLDGCNKVACSCGNYMVCWSCGEELNKTSPYDHFQKPNKSGKTCKLHMTPKEEEELIRTRVLESGVKVRR